MKYYIGCSRFTSRAFHAEPRAAPSRNGAYYSNSAGDCPDANGPGARRLKRPGAGTGRCAGRKYIIYQYDALAVQTQAPARGKRAPNILRALRSCQQRLRARRLDPF